MATPEKDPFKAAMDDIAATFRRIHPDSPFIDAAGGVTAMPTSGEVSAIVGATADAIRQAAIANASKLVLRDHLEGGIE